MGVIRLVLAVAVVASHSGGIPAFAMIPGATAVQSFYVISGFYMALILNEKYVGKRPRYWLFISSRLLRLLPLYWVSLVTAIFSAYVTYGHFDRVLSTYPIAYASELSIGTLAYSLWSNTCIIGQDLALYLGIDSSQGTLYLTSDYHTASLPAHRLLLVPQGWSLAIEMLFYLIAPLIVTRRATTIFAIMCTSLVLRALLYSEGMSFDPWTRRFFPNELALFLWGALSYRLYIKLQALRLSKFIQSEVFILLLALLFGFPYLFNDYPNLRLFLFLFTLGVCIPSVFLLSQNWKIDRVLGELSYPVYLIHVCLIWLAVVFVGVSNGTVSMTVIPASLVIALLMHYFIAQPIESFRRRRFEASQQI